MNYHIGLNPVSITVVDLNLDNKMDLAVAFNGDYDTGQPGGIGLLLANGVGTFQPVSTVSPNWYPSDLAAGDFNGDRKPDLVVANANGYGSASVFLGKGTAPFRHRSATTLREAPLPSPWETSTVMLNRIWL